MEPRRFLSLNDALSVVSSGSDAHALRQFNFMNSGQPAPVARLLQDLGFGLKFEKLPMAVSATLEPDSWPEKGFNVVVNSAHSRMRQRFSAAHEVGHYYIHVDPRDVLAPTKHRASGQTFDHLYGNADWIEETEANQWADAVIFGGNALEGALGLFGRDAEKLSRHFGFSVEVIQRALLRRKL